MEPRPVIYAPYDEQFDRGPDALVVEHVVRPDWDGPGKIRAYCWDGPEEALRRAAEMKPTEEDAVAVRAYDQTRKVWLDDGTPAWNPAIHKPKE